VLAEMKSAGLSARRIAAQLMARGIPTPAGATWHAQTVIRVLNRVQDRGARYRIQGLPHPRFGETPMAHRGRSDENE
jgi:hypothetical protein